MEINSIESSAIPNSESISFSFGLYNEIPATSVYNNIEVALTLLQHAQDEGGNTICCLKQQNRIAAKNEYSNKGFNKAAITFLHR